MRVVKLLLSLRLSYKDALRAPAKSIYKKSIFELSTSIPFEEQPSLSNIGHPSLQDHSDHLTVSTMADPTSPAVTSSPSTTFIQFTTAPASNITTSTQSPSLHSTIHCPLPTHPIMTSTTRPTTSKGKAPMYPQPSLPFLSSPPLSSLRINDTPTVPSPTRMRSFARQNCQVRSSVRSMLKRARASHSDFSVVPSMSDNEETAGVAQQPRFNDRNTQSLTTPHAMHSFQNFIGKYSLFPLSFSGSRFTWKHGTTLERLDWAIVNQKWANLFPTASLHHLGFFGSDHRGLKVLLEGNPNLFARNPTFRFDNHWLLEPDFPELLTNSWTTDSITTNPNNPILNFLSKQQNCSVSLSSWGRNKNQFSHRIKSIQSDIDRVLAGPIVSHSDATKANDLQRTLDNILIKEEIFRKQRSRVNWLKAGDKNTRYFHNRASTRKRTNFIKSLTLDDDSQITNLNDITSSFVQFYTELFASQGTNPDAMCIATQGLSKQLTPNQSAFLTSPFTFHEVKAALFQLAGDKAPGPDGFNPSFFQKNWDSAGRDLCQAALFALTTNADLAPLNETILVLIPKIKNASRVKDFWPISLCSTFYKVVSKTIANCLKSTLPDLISHNQGAFLSDRIIFDNIIIANEVIHAINNRKHGKVGWVALKLDMEKAFDKVEWAYIKHILQHFGFPYPFISLINNCLSHKIFPTRGIRQGDPLSPYLFLLVAEGLSGIINAKTNSNSFHGISISRSAPSISHLLFADDSLLFTKVSPSTCTKIKDILSLYHQATGQSVNFHKSSILFSPNTTSSDCHIFRNTLNLDDKPFIDKYLGVPQCFSRSKNSSFLFLLQKASSKLSIWNQNLFSRVGKEILLKSVIQAIPSYAMSCFCLPVSLCKHYSRLMSKFWWGSLGERHKIHWKKWDNLCTSKFFGGLGFRNIVHHNQAMLAKQAWRILTSPDSLVGELLKAKYFKRNDFLHAATGHSPSFCWCSILWGRDLLIKGLIWKIGDGTLVNISESNWLPFHDKVMFKPGLSPPSHHVSFFLTEDRHWDLSKLRFYFDEQMCNHDTLIWSHHHSGYFTVNSAYHLANSTFSSPGPSNPATYKRWWTSVWSSNISPKIKHFVWKAFNHILPSNLNLFHLWRILSVVICRNTGMLRNAYPYRLPPSISLLQEYKSQEQCFQLSVDAALSHSSNKHGYGAAVTNSRGNVIATFMAPSHSGLPPFYAEAEALNRALLWWQAVRFPIAVIASDCQNLVHRIQKFSPDRSALSRLVAMIVSSLSSFPGASVHYIPRSTNTTAHGLARAALGMDKEITWNHLSSSP
uniref:Reverse transcriptase domain-containing protein n=1 Tax=Cannabis sativa TaxID=3483 RepID=A0A803QHF5_CANSA